MTAEKATLLEAISLLCERFPDWRFGQLVSNVAGWADVEVWDVEDGHLLDAIRSFLNQPGRAETSAPAVQSAC